MSSTTTTITSIKTTKSFRDIIRQPHKQPDIINKDYDLVLKRLNKWLNYHIYVYEQMFLSGDDTFVDSIVLIDGCAPSMNKYRIENAIVDVENVRDELVNNKEKYKNEHLFYEANIVYYKYSSDMYDLIRPLLQIYFK